MLIVVWPTVSSPALGIFAQDLQSSSRRYRGQREWTVPFRQFAAVRSAKPTLPPSQRSSARGFPNRTRQFWSDALARLTRREPPPGFPKYGYLLESGDVAVGALLLICSTMREDGRLATRCNLSSWYVEPAYRAYATLLVSQALADKDATYTNVSAAPHTWPIIEAQGFSRYCDGVFVAVPMLKDLFGGERRARLRRGREPDSELRCLRAGHPASVTPSMAASACGARAPDAPTRSFSGPASSSARFRARN